MPKLTFTFDNGPWPGATDAVLDFLAERSIKASFFVVGERIAAEGGRALAERAHSEGHYIANHTLTHGTPLGRDGGRERVQREIGETEKLIDGLAHPRKFFRPNGSGALGPHLLSPEAIAYLQEHAYTVITWNNVPGDWLAPHEDWYETALKDLEGADWTVLVLHDQHIARMLDLLARFCDELQARGIDIVQDFPASCTVMEKGRPTPAMDQLLPVEA
ncbi:polysaccharide deacetylase family protein [Afifella sp. IM 167]|uniref:polysaccharide deacetylase family protein n=1 Tax=Afifella sp. IM 167 TaxID=2033586 RepID=UPI001CCA23F9|nr:polysaccharide deacetylase family protein [Afifella sp. IM 167]MBZ8133733.1 polysaccharide deacetylase [Afifella sp. IM 167]